jgi:hypothetical protein
MAQTIALNLTLNGVEQTITSVQELEKAIKDARTALGNFSGEQEELKSFNKQINDAQQSLDTLRNKKGKEETIKSIGNLAKIGSAVTSSFAAATAAVSLFGGNTEAVAKAAEKAQLALTLALSGREIAEGAVAIATGVANLQTELQILSTNAANAATKRFYATLAANPYTAIAIAIGVVIAAVYALTSAENEELKLQKQLVGVRQGAAKEQKAQLTILTDNVKTLNLELDAIEDLKKTYPGFNAFVDKNNQLNQAGINFLSAKIGLMEQEAIIQAALAIKAEAQIKYQERLLEIQNQKPGIFSGSGGVSFESLQNAARLVAQKDFEKATKGATAAVAQATQKAEKYSGIIRDGNKILQGQVDLEDANKKSKDAAADAIQKQTDRYKALLEAQNEAVKNYGKLNEGEAKVSNETLEKAKEFEEKGKKLLQDRNAFFSRLNNELVDETQKLLFDIVPTGAELKSLEDIYIDLFFTIGNAVSSGAVKLLDNEGKAIKLTLENVKDIQKAAIIDLEKQREELINNPKLNMDTRRMPLNRIDNEIKKLKKDLGAATPEAQNALILFYQRIAQTAEIYGKGIKIGDKIVSPKTKKDITTTLTDLTQEVVDILNNPSIIPGLKDTEITKAVKRLFVFDKKSQKDFITALDKTGKEGFDAYNKGVEAAIENLAGFGKAQAAQSKESNKAAEELKKQEQKLFDLREALGVVPGPSPGITGLIKLNEDQITGYIDFVKEKIGEEPELLAGYLESIFDKRGELFQRLGEKGVMDLFSGISSGFGDLTGKSEAELNKLISFLEKSAADIEVKFGKPAAQSFIDLANNAKDALSSIGNQKFLEGLQKGIVEFISTLSDLGSTISDFYSLQLTKLENQNTKIQAQILGDSEKSNQKRIEQEKLYQDEKAALEKKAAIRSLQISRATALANAAESITKIFAKNEPVSAAIFAAIVAANNLVQVGIITAQINELDAYQRGGMIKGQGGLLVGPAHEQGGIRFGAMGLELEGGESVINRKSTMNYGALLSQINQSGGGKPLVSNNFDDSRILEALAKQRNEPIRAYVVESEITNKQGITKRLEQLSQF